VCVCGSFPIIWSNISGIFNYNPIEWAVVIVELSVDIVKCYFVKQYSGKWNKPAEYLKFIRKFVDR